MKSMKFAAAIIAGTIAVSGLAFPAQADEDRPEIEHYRAEASETLKEAVRNFSEYNKRVSEVLKTSELSPMDVERIHEATYTLEESLEEIEEGVEDLEARLERLHRASEAHREKEVRESAGAYLETANTIIP